MNRPTLLRFAWIHVKKYAAPVMAAGLIYGGISQVISALRYIFTNGILQLINAVILRGSPDHLSLPDYGPIPWLFHARIVAMGVMVIAVGILVGLWANARSQRQPTP